MASLKSRIRRPIYRKLSEWRQAVSSVSPQWARNFFGPVYDYFDMIFIDHGIFRLVYRNCFRLGNDSWRAAQPWPHQVRSYARKGIKTIVNLRGDRDCGSYRLEVAACKKYGINLVNYKMRSGAPPDPEVVKNFKDFFEGLEYPILLHCKSGADRAGIASVLFMHLKEGLPLDEAIGQLHFRFGHFKHSKSGVLDHFFSRYREKNETQPISLLDWVDSDYDQVEVKASFKSSYWANLLTQTLLRRE